MDTSKCLLITETDSNADGVSEIIIEFVTRERGFENDDAVDRITDAYAVRVTKAKPGGAVDRVYNNSDLDGDQDVDGHDKRLLLDLATAVERFNLNDSSK